MPRKTLFVVQDPYGKHQAVSYYAEREYFYCLDKLRGTNIIIKGGLGPLDKLLRHVRLGSQIVDGFCKEIMDPGVHTWGPTGGGWLAFSHVGHNT